ncbi:hypothetical protein [Acidovorax sp. sic0104]|uniref:hypothetical protein n=1 Tax=Acidovorax sp. sic0104 TaxID=2854784 RepID=UPI001C4899DA|nr:hypothetical protein [Acidovorax sp. sic0104]MBV7542226.1 hypothetical protein [Acidovorax sp. sic0104]
MSTGLIHRAANLIHICTIGASLSLAVVALLNAAWLSFHVPLTESDFAQASWLGSPAWALHPSTSVLGVAVAAGAVLVGVALWVRHRLLTPLAVALTAVAVTQFGMSEAAVARVGLLDGTVRIGCFVPEARECREMLRLEVSGARSRYPDAGTPADRRGNLNDTWYDARLEAEVPMSVRALIPYYIYPGAALIRSLAHLGKADELRGVVEAQRAQLRRMHANAD